jgi:hypothetical protein
MRKVLQVYVKPLDTNINDTIMETSQNIQHLNDSTSSIMLHIEPELIPPTLSSSIPIITF